jgi:hypothetical protein
MNTATGQYVCYLSIHFPTSDIHVRADVKNRLRIPVTTDESTRQNYHHAFTLTDSNRPSPRYIPPYLQRDNPLHKSVAGLNTTTASAYLFATTIHVALFSTFFHPVNLSHTAHISVRNRQSVLTLLTGFHWFLLAKLVSPKSWRWHGGMKLKPKGQSGLRVQALEYQSKHPGDLALRADSNSAMPGLGCVSMMGGGRRRGFGC